MTYCFNETRVVLQHTVKKRRESRERKKYIVSVVENNVEDLHQLTFMASQTSFGPQEATAVATCQSQLIQLEQVKPKSQIKPWKNGPQRRGDTVGQGTVGFWRFYTGELEN